MRKHQIIYLVFFMFVSLGFHACNAQPQVNVQQFEQQMAQPNTVLLDVRTTQEYRSGHLPNALNMDIYDRAFEQKILALDKSKTILVYCRSGSRSASAASLLRKNGYQVVDLAGGIGAWAVAGKKIVND